MVHETAGQQVQQRQLRKQTASTATVCLGCRCNCTVQQALPCATVMCSGTYRKGKPTATLWLVQQQLAVSAKPPNAKTLSSPSFTADALLHGCLWRTIPSRCAQPSIQHSHLPKSSTCCLSQLQVVVYQLLGQANSNTPAAPNLHDAIVLLLWDVITRRRAAVFVIAGSTVGRLMI